MGQVGRARWPYVKPGFQRVGAIDGSLRTRLTVGHAFKGVFCKTKNVGRLHARVNKLYSNAFTKDSVYCILKAFNPCAANLKVSF